MMTSFCMSWIISAHLDGSSLKPSSVMIAFSEDLLACCFRLLMLRKCCSQMQKAGPDCS